jgi:hypothetical protein
MGWFNGLANITGLQAANIYNNPEQAAIGANTPESTYALNKTLAPTLDKHYTPTVSMTGGYTQGEMQQNAQQGYSNTGAQAANAVGNAVATYLTGGAATPLIMGQAAADQYARAHPHSNFNQEYNGIIASNPNINAGLSTSGYGSGYSYAKGGDVEQPSGLQQLAQQVQSQGRGKDTVLVHMTPNEVGGLQALAKAHGGSLTRNPQTGLYEAGFLSSVLPMVAGVAASAFLGPEMLPLVAGGIGLADYAMTGSLQQGLMAGLGAWSGYSLGAGIGAAGAADLAAEGADQSAAAFEGAQKQAAEGWLPKTIGNEAYTPSTSGFSPTEMMQGSNPGMVKDLATQQLNAMGAPNLFNEAVANAPVDQVGNIMRGAGAAAVNPTAAQGFTQGITSLSDIGSAIKANPLAAAGAALPLVSGALFKQPTVNAPASSVTTVNQPLQRLSSNYQGIQPVPPNPKYQAAYPNYTQMPYNPYTGTPAVQSPGATTYAAEGGLMGIKSYAMGGDISQVNPAQTDFMAGGGTTSGGMYPQSQQDHTQFATPTQMPASAAVMNSDFDTKTNPLTGAQYQTMADGGLTAFAEGSKKAVGNKDMAAIDDYTEQAQSGGIASVKDAADNGDWNAQLALQKLGYKAGGGGISSLGSYSDGGHLLKGPGDGVSDSIPAQIGSRQPARLADGEFVVPARIVSELGNGSTDAGAKRLYAMMERVQAKRKKSMGKGKFAVNSKAEKDLPA